MHDIQLLRNNYIVYSYVRKYQIRLIVRKYQELSAI